MPAAVYQAKGSADVIKIGPGGHGIYIPVPGDCFIHRAVFNSVNGFITEVLKLVIAEITGYGATVMNKICNDPLPVGHRFDKGIFFLVFDILFTPGKE